MIKNIIDIIKNKAGSVSFSPATKEEITLADNRFNDNIFAKIPAEYKEFLTISDGLIYDGIEFFGCQPHQRKKYVFPDIYTINKAYAQYSYFDSKIIIGRLSEGFIIYDAQNDVYTSTDRINLYTRQEEKSLYKLMLHLFDLEPRP